ncbi:hypothetical protein RRG08_023108 [Elysia crispata]|uniref:Uncharacterized protein n=1 Tax=Elysia crispata TaxID=231223 RepID=A0AAE1CUV8_9GAST|nr:hypothetical protein RRG08_023108 [Elysia crispata]
MPVVCQAKTEILGIAGPHNKSFAESHMADFQQILTEDCFKEHSTNGDAVKPLVFISVDDGPDEAPQNTRTLVMWAATFKQLNLDACFIFSHAPGSSAYNPVERRMAPLSKMTASIILPFDSFGSHLNASNKTIDPVLEKKNFEAAGEILSQVFNEAEIDGYPVVSKFVSEVSEEVTDDLNEKWKSDHVLQSQYMCQIVKCLDTSCCRPFRTNYAVYFPDRFLPPPVPIKACAEGLKVEKSGHFGSMFQALHINRIVKTDCFDQHCPSLNQPDAKGMTKLQKRTCSRCGKYHSTIKHKNAHMRVCFRQTTDSGHSEIRVSDSESDGEGELNEEMGTLERDPGLADRNIF